MATPAVPPGMRVRVRAPARLHLGFVDPDATLGRRFGSLGLVLDAPATDLSLAWHVGTDRLSHAASVDAQRGSAELQRCERHLAVLRDAAGLARPVALTLHEALAPHTGLGSGTQLALAVGRAFARLAGWRVTTGELARLLGRAERSGIGVAGFDQGGVLLDAGRRVRSSAEVAAGVPQSAAPVIARFELPAPWRVLLVRDERTRGLHGEAEREAIRALPPFPRASAAHLSHLLLMRLLPALAEHEFEPFAQAVSEMQRHVGEHFAGAQGGLFTSEPVGRLVQWLGEHRGAGIGQSSWGPTGFAVFASQAAAERALADARAHGRVDAALRIDCVAAAAQGARLTLEALAHKVSVP